MSQFYGDAIFWIDIDKVKPNPFQPRKEFDAVRLKDLAESIRTYGVLQPLVVTRKEIEKPDGGLAVEYELISGERRLRASKLVGVQSVPAIIRNDTNDDGIKLELAIIENLQREDLNAVDRAKAFQRLVDEFSYKHSDIATKVGKSREYVSNTIRILSMPEEMLQALVDRKISEGHTRPILMLTDRPEEQNTLFKEILLKKLNVREAEAISRRIAFDRVRRKDRAFDPELIEIEERLSESLGTRVQIEKREKGGKIMIDYFSPEDLRALSGILDRSRSMNSTNTVGAEIAPPALAGDTANVPNPLASEPNIIVVSETPADSSASDLSEDKDDISSSDENSQDDDLYSIRNFSL